MNKVFRISVCWFTITLFILMVGFVYFPTSLLSHMVIFIWGISGIVVLYKARRIKKIGIQRTRKILFLIAGILLIILSFINQIFSRTGTGFIFWNPPYSIGEFAILVSGVSIIFFAILGYKQLLFPSGFPALTLVVYQMFELFQNNIEWIALPLLWPTTWLSTTVLGLLGIHAFMSGPVNSSYIIHFISREGQLIDISIVTDCTGIWSLSAFTASLLLVAMVFPKIFSRKGAVFSMIGYIGTYAANIIRVVIICLSAYFYGYSKTTNLTHIHAGWIAFSVWMLIFWYLFFSRYLLKKENGK